MQPFIAIQRMLWVISLIVQTLLVLRLIRERIVRRYPLFTTYITLETITSLVLIQIPAGSAAYAEAYRFCTLAFLVLRAGVACELWERICEHLPGIGAWRFTLASVFLTFGFLMTLFTWRPDLSHQLSLPQTTAVILKRFEGEIYPLVFLAMWLFVRHVLTNKRPFRPNVYHHWMLCVGYFAVGGSASILVLFTGGGDWVYPINCGMFVLEIAFLTMWLKLMNRAGEELPYFHRLEPAAIEHVRIQNRDLMDLVTSLPRNISARLKGRPNIGLPGERPRESRMPIRSRATRGEAGKLPR